MRGFSISSVDGAQREVEATHYEVTDDGSLIVLLDEFEIARAAPGEWRRIDEFGERLSDRWPHPNLDNVLDGAKAVLGLTFGHYVHNVGVAEKYARGFFNDLDALAAALLASVGVDWSASDTEEVGAVRAHLANAFGVPVPDSPIRPSTHMTDVHCPRCGDVLYTRPDPNWTLECRKGAMGLSDKGTEWIKDYCERTADPAADRTTTVSWGGRWFCPVDGMRMDTSPTELPRCAWCSRVMDGRLVYHLIEMHVHA